MELDRAGNRYDTFMLDPANEMTPGEDNNFDGDYYKARWSETGVIEADCLLCHLPTYNKKARDEQVSKLNFKWAATAGAGFADIIGSVKEGGPVNVRYDRARFDSEGHADISIVREPASQVCMQCHHETDWKKKGTVWNERTDAHMRAGLRCVDCHPAGSSASDARISGKEVHQFAKGDDPGGLVRDDLDDTMMSCEECHAKGHLGAPVPQHASFPPLHLEKISCQACHIPERQVKAALVQDSAVWNTGPFVPLGKRIWSFYGPDMLPWNFYGEKARFTSEFQPTAPYKPYLEWYKGKIYPLSRLYAVWVGIETEGQPALGQPFMRHMVKMWTSHNADPARSPRLSEIRDDIGDGYPEVNRPDEISAIIESVAEALREESALPEGKHVVFVNGDRLYRSPEQYRTLEKHPYEYSPYGSVFKLSHDVAPAAAALGAKGCAECHSTDSHFFAAEVLKNPFTEEGARLTVPMHEELEYSRLAVNLGEWRERALRGWSFLIFAGVAFLLLAHYVIFGPKRVESRPDDVTVIRFTPVERFLHYLFLASFAILAISGMCFLLGRHSPLALLPAVEKTVRSVHPFAGVAFAVVGLLILLRWAGNAAFRSYDIQWLGKLGGYFAESDTLPADKFNAGQKLYILSVILAGAVMAGTGAAMSYPETFGRTLSQVSYTVHDITAILFIVMAIAHLYMAILANPGTIGGMFTGRVSRAWAEKHHPLWLDKEMSETKKD